MIKIKSNYCWGFFEMGTILIQEANKSELALKLSEISKRLWNREISIQI